MIKSQVFVYFFEAQCSSNILGLLAVVEQSRVLSTLLLLYYLYNVFISTFYFYLSIYFEE